MILSCELLPGQRVTEKGLSAEIGYGIAPIRGALTRLDQDGLIVTLARSGYRVTPLTAQSIDDLLDVWHFLGPEIGRRGILNASPSQRKAIARGFERIEAASLETPGPATGRRMVARIDATFELLTEAAGSAYLTRMSGVLTADLSRVWVLALSADPGILHLPTPASWWRDVVTNPEPDIVAARLEQTIATVRSRIQELVSRWPSVVSAEVTPPPSLSRRSPAQPR